MYVGRQMMTHCCDTIHDNWINSREQPQKLQTVKFEEILFDEAYNKQKIRRDGEVITI